MVPDKNLKHAGAAIIAGLRPIQDKVHAKTFDNSREFSGHAKIDKALQSISCFADIFSNWQGVANENRNGLVRQYIQKTTSASDCL